MDEPPRTAVFQGFRVVGIVVGQTLRNILRLTYVIAACGFAFQNVKEIHKCEIGGADGVRTHDLLDAIEARSQLRHGPTEVAFKILPQDGATGFAASISGHLRVVKNASAEVREESTAAAV